MDILKLEGIILFIVAFLNLLLAFFLWGRDRKNRVILHLGFVAFFSALFAFTQGALFFFWETASYNLLLFISRASWFGVLILPAFVTFTYYFIGKTKNLKIISSLIYLGGIVISSLAITTPLFIEKIDPSKLPLYAEETGQLEPIGRIYILFCLILGLGNLLKYYFQTRGFKKLQSKYFIVGAIIYSVGGIITTSLIPLIFKTYKYVHIAAYLSLFWVGLTSYAVLRYRLWDLRFVLGRTAVYILSILTEIAIAFLIIFLNAQLGFLLPINIVLIIVLIIIALSFIPLFHFFERIAGRYFYYTFYTLQTTLATLSKKLNQTIELDNLTTLINRSLLDALKLDKVGIILREPEKNLLQPQQLIKLKEEDILALLTIEDNFLPKYLQKTKTSLARDEIPFLIKKTEKEEKRKFNLLKQEMERGEIALFLPLFIEEELIGMIILGDKLSREAYTVQDIDILTTFTAQASIAFNNALSYYEIERRKADLEKFYKLTIGRELKMVELKKQIKELEEKLKK